MLDVTSNLAIMCTTQYGDLVDISDSEAAMSASEEVMMKGIAHIQLCIYLSITGLPVSGSQNAKVRDVNDA